VLTDDDTDSQVFGYIVFWQLLDEAQILNVAVRLDSRGLGYGDRLVREVIRSSIKKNLKKVVLDVRKSNLAAIHLYQKIGFLTARIQKQFYSNGEDGFAMELSLTGEDVAKFLNF
jgi:ribosomal-protein-alanine N-acetyltransferase